MGWDGPWRGRLWWLLLQTLRTLSAPPHLGGHRVELFPYWKLLAPTIAFPGELTQFCEIFMHRRLVALHRAWSVMPGTSPGLPPISRPCTRPVCPARTIIICMRYVGGFNNMASILNGFTVGFRVYYVKLSILEMRLMLRLILSFIFLGLMICDFEIIRDGADMLNGRGHLPLTHDFSFRFFPCDSHVHRGSCPSTVWNIPVNVPPRNVQYCRLFPYSSIPSPANPRNPVPRAQSTVQFPFFELVVRTSKSVEVAGHGEQWGRAPPSLRRERRRTGARRVSLYPPRSRFLFFSGGCLIYNKCKSQETHGYLPTH